MNTNWDEIRGKTEREQNVPTKTFTHNGTQYALTGDHQRAHSHFHEARAHLGKMKMINVNNLPIISGIKYFDDGSVATFKVVHGKEDIHITSPMAQLGGGVSSEKKGTREIETLIPCFIVTAADEYSDEIVGYIASMGGSFTGPYQWFNVPANDGTAVLEGFYHEGFMYYNADLAFAHMRPLSVYEEVGETLYFYRPSGLAPEESRADDGPDSSSGAKTEACGSLTFYDGADDEWVWTAAMSDNPISGSEIYGYEQLFDGVSVGDKYEQTITYGGHYLVGHGEESCKSLEEGEPPPSSCYDAIAAFKASFEFPVSCLHVFDNTNSFDEYTLTETKIETFLDDFPNGNIRLNEVLDDSAYLLESWDNAVDIHTWNHQPLPSPYNNDWGSLPCDGCFTEDVSWANELFIVVDNGARQSVSGAFSWGMARKYKGMDGEGLVYHKTGENSTTLAAVKSGASDAEGNGNYTDMAFIYLGPVAEGFDGSVSFPIENQGGDEYVVIPNVAGAPINTEYRVRGQIFLGLVIEEGIEA